MGQDEGGLVLAVQITGKLDNGDALGSVHGDADRSQQVNEVHLARCKDGARRDRELTPASLALELAMGADGLGFAAAAVRANRHAIGPAHFAELGVSSFLAIFLDGAQAQGASGGREKEVLGHDTVSDVYISNIVCKHTEHKGLYIVYVSYFRIGDT